MSEYKLPEGFKKITLQDIFNAAWQAFIVEDRPAASEKGTCSYLTSDGRKCAVGLVIPDGHPTQTEPKTWDTFVSDYPDLFDEEILQMSKGALACFQRRLHDSMVGNNEWLCSVEGRRTAYQLIANDYNLTIPGE